MNNTVGVLYKNTIVINPKPFFTFRKPVTTNVIVSENREIVFETNPKIIIPFIKISKIKYSYWWSGKIKIFLTDGTIYRIVWASEDKGTSFRYSTLETADIFNNLKRIIKINMDNQIVKSKKTISNWMIFYIIMIVAGQQLAGIGGAIGGAFIVFGLNKVLRNPNYTKGKKILYSVLYSIGGIIITLVIAVIVAMIIQSYFPELLTE